MLSTPQSFDYDSLPPDCAESLRLIAHKVRGLARTQVQTAFVIGQLLLEAKSKLGHGRFGGWTTAEFGITDRTARNYMNLARTFEAKTEMISVLSLGAAYELSSPSTPDDVREEVIEMVRNNIVPGASEIKHLKEGRQRGNASATEGASDRLVSQPNDNIYSSQLLKLEGLRSAADIICLCLPAVQLKPLIAALKLAGSRELVEQIELLIDFIDRHDLRKSSLPVEQIRIDPR